MSYLYSTFLVLYKICREFSMLRISKLADYAAMFMTHFAQAPAIACTAKDLSIITQVALPTVTKVLKFLARDGLLSSQRGTKGGYRLARDPQAISLANVLEAIEGKFGLTECSEQEGSCALERCCTVQTNLQFINEALYNTLNNISLAQLTRPLAHDTQVKENLLHFFKPVKNNNPTLPSTQWSEL